MPPRSQSLSRPISWHSCYVEDAHAIAWAARDQEVKEPCRVLTTVVTPTELQLAPRGLLAEQALPHEIV